MSSNLSLSDQKSSNFSLSNQNSSNFSLSDQKSPNLSRLNPKSSDFSLSDPKLSDFFFSDYQPSKFIFSNSLDPPICTMARSQSTSLLADARAASLVPDNQSYGTSTAAVNPINTEECRVRNRKLVLPTHTLSSKPDAYHTNVHYATVSTLETEGRGISYQSRLSMLAQVTNQQLIANINIRHWLQSYEEQLVEPSKFTIIGFYRGNSTTLDTATVAGNNQIFRPTGNSMTHIARAFRCPSNIKFLSVEVAMDFEDLAKSPCECTFQTFFQLPIESR